MNKCKITSKDETKNNQKQGRFNSPNSYNEMGEVKLEENVNLNNEINENETYYIDGVKVTIERTFIKNGKNIIDRLFELFEQEDIELSSI